MDANAPSYVLGAPLATITVLRIIGFVTTCLLNGYRQGTSTVYEVENTTANMAAQKRADISAANKKPIALSLMGILLRLPPVPKRYYNGE
ncbi:hypothetical protein GGE67_004733 [Rhizobium leucaenae]|uniref:Uncharacterized protein n=1 Tax=Rhizobium leucaenae TaxID=29450 RepID=A0A7W6ZYN3_9HYPH|nr:hypothetical protein [Rhizobium leucaenae]MBB6304090.1 hypothetical protein [Rhizobium leucaenae]